MNVYISDVENDRMHPMSMGRTELSDELESLGIDAHANLDKILIALIQIIKELKNDPST